MFLNVTADRHLFFHLTYVFALDMLSNTMLYLSMCTIVQLKEIL